ncbi:MAG: gliding motility-associated C-terminal domain-containing protein [Bacteroidota bacterium]|nr:gliding motility-associated C-terminal domain-containing protein [Bacteroidota bacterium]
MSKSNFKKIFLIIALFIIWERSYYCQNAAVCNSAQNLCTNALFSFTASSGTGLTPGLNVSNPLSNPQAVNAGCMFTNVPNPQWLILNITTSGNLAFSFGEFGSAFPQAGNYDWIMWPYTPSTCVDIFNNTLPPVACNWNCTGSGGTGMGPVPVGATFCNYQPSIPVVQGQQYIILITNPSGVNTNVSFSSTGSAGVSCNPLNYPNLTACPGQLAVFTGTWVNASSGSYTLYPGTIVQSNPSFTVSSLVNQVYTVTAQGLNSSLAPIADQTTFTLTINPVIPISISTPTNFCYGSNATFTINPSVGGTFSVTGPGYPQTIFPTTSISISNITTPNIGTFSVIANYTNGCTGTQTTAVNVAPNNSITINTSSNVCQGGTINLTSAMPTATAYSWSGPNAFVSNLQNPSISSILPASSGIYTVSSNINFNGIACPKTNTTQIDVVATGTIAVTPNFTLCEGSNLNLTSSALGAVSYSWNGPNAYASSAQNPTKISIIPNEAGNYSVVAYFTNGILTCTTGAVSNVSVVATSTVNVVVPSNICQNATANLSASAIGALSYAWSGPNTFTSNIAAPSILNIQTNGSGTYSSTATFAIGTVSCTTTGTNQISVVGTNTVLVTPNFTLCEASNLNLTSSALGAVSYSWNGPGAYNSVSQNPTINGIIPTGAGNYTAIAFFTNGVLTCTTDAVSNVSVVATSTVNVVVPTNICQNATANLSASATGALAFAWSGPNAFSSNIPAPTITNIQPNGSGIYTSTATFAIGTVSCTTTGTNQISVVATNTVAATPNFTLCEGANLNLTSSAVGAVSYSWNGPGAYNSISQNPTITGVVPATAGNYTAIAFFTNGILTCTTNAVSNVSVVATPTITVTAPANICQNATANLSANALGAISYSWSGPNAFTSAIAAPSIVNIQTNGAGIYTTTAMFSIGTVSCTSTTTNQINVVGTNTINVTPTFTICENANLNLVSNALSAVSYSWNGPGGYTSAIQNPTVIAVNPSGAGDYTATAFFSNGNITCTTSAVSNVSVVATPAVNVIVPANICQNATANISTNAVGGISYLWTGPNGFSSNLASTSIGNIQTNAAGIYTSTAMFSIGTVSCTNTGTNQINVVAINSISINPVMNGCALQSNVLQANSLGAVSYLWNGPNSFTASVANPTLLNTPLTASGFYTVTAFYTNGVLTCTNSGVLNLIVNPVVSFTLPASEFICYNSVLNIPGPAGATSYTWENSGGVVSNAQNLSLSNVTSNQAGTYSLTAAIGFCKTTQTTFVTVSSPIKYLYVPQNISICRGDSIKLNVAAYNASGNYAYVWNPAVFLSSSTGSIQTAAPVGTTIYNVSAYDIACPNYTIAHTFTVTVKQPPLPELYLDNTIGCEPFCATYNSNLGAGASSVVYDFGGINQITGDNFNYCINEPGTYELNILTVGVNGCSGKFKYIDPIIVYPKPHADFSYLPEMPTITNNKVVFIPTELYGPIISRSWSFTGTGITGMDTSSLRYPTRFYENTGKFATMLITTTDKGCVDTVFKLVEIIDDMSVYIPNTFTPNGDGKNELFIAQGIGFSKDDFIMEIFASNGNQIYFSRDFSRGWDGTIKGQMAEVGTYIYKIKVKGTHGEGYKEYVGYVNLIK